MGPQQVLRAAALLVLVGVSSAHAGGWSAKTKPASLAEHVAIIDLGPNAEDASTRGKLAAAVIDGGLQPVIGDGVEDALAGIDVEHDGVELAAAMADAAGKFGALQCKDAIASAQTAIALGAARQAAGIGVPELPRAWAYVLLCADRTGDTTLAVSAATALRTLGGSPDVDATILARYPEIDALSNREAIEIEVQADTPGAEVWIDFKHAGVSPLKIVLSGGPHVIAAASGTQRGVVTGTVIRKQPIVTVPLTDQSSKWSAVAKRVASWKGTMPKPADLAGILDTVGARVAIVRRGDTIEAWGHAGLAEPLRQLGGKDDGVRTLDGASSLVALIADRSQTWSDHAPDPDQPLLVDDPLARRTKKALGESEEPAKWWVYATIGGALLAGAIIIYAHDSADNTQHVELHYP